jgi:phospholipid/cholesterol/gamma-HCH transport system permease protein
MLAMKLMRKDTALDITAAQDKISFSRSSEDILVVRLAGSWKITQALPSADEVRVQLESSSGIGQITFATQELTDWDSGLLTFLIKVIEQCYQHNIQVDMEGLPQGVQRLIELATAVPEKEDARKTVEHKPFLEQIGNDVVDFVQSTGEIMAFLGEAFVATTKMLTGKARFRPIDLGLFLQENGARALPIVSLISALVGLILAFVGIIQLKLFGAQIYVADLVGIAMVRQMGAIMTGIIMAGRTGAAFAAQLGTMQVNEEIDALQTLGISPMEFLVLPRMLALTVMMPLLCLYANLMGIIGGAVVGVGLYDINFMLYLNRTTLAVGLNDLGIGLFMSLIFGVLVALAGCLRGMQCGRSASAVGDAATSAVVTGIVAIIVATAIITVVCDVIGI